MAVASKTEVQGVCVGLVVGLVRVQAGGFEGIEEVEAEKEAAAAGEAALFELSRRAYEGLPEVARRSKTLLPQQGQRVQWANPVLLGVSLGEPPGVASEE